MSMMIDLSLMVKRSTLIVIQERGGSTFAGRLEESIEMKQRLNKYVAFILAALATIAVIIMDWP